MDAMTAPHRHPWPDRLIAAPGAEVRALAEGTASVHPYRRAEPSDAAATLLFGLAADDPALHAFDKGTLETLTQYRAATARSDREQRNRTALAAIDLMTVVQRLTPHDTVIDLHRRFAYWNAWAETLVLDRGLDLRREYWRVLALTQDIAAASSLAPRRLLPFWLDICGESGSRGRYDESYLTVGLLGLRSLPLGNEGAANEEAALHGLARWADAQRPAKKQFLREWHVLEGAFPRDPTFWTDLVARIIASVEEEITRQTNGARDTFPAAAWWREDVEAVKGAQVAPLAAELQPPPIELRDSLLADIRSEKPLSTFKIRLDNLFQRHERYATRTGDTFYPVRTACYIGKRLLQGGELSERAAKARELARLALRFEGANVYAWVLWRDALAAEGHLEAAELLGWETIRRFPEDPQWRTQLAPLLILLNRPHEAEVLLRETVQLFPDDVVARTQLALMLADQLDRPQEAEILLRETVKLFQDNVVAHTQLANVIGRDSARLKEAITLLDAALRIDPVDELAQSMKRRFENGQISRQRQAVAPVASTLTERAAIDLPVDLVTSARLRRALFLVRTPTLDSEAAKNEVKAVLSEDENLAYARYAAAAAGIIDPTTDDSVAAAAYLASTREGTTEALQRLEARLQGLDGVVISLVGVLRGDQIAATRLRAWMEEPANDLSPRDHGLRAIVARVTAPLPPDFVGDLLAASLGTAMAA